MTKPFLYFKKRIFERIENENQKSSLIMPSEVIQSVFSMKNLLKEMYSFVENALPSFGWVS